MLIMVPRDARIRFGGMAEERTGLPSRSSPGNGNGIRFYSLLTMEV